ncbi:TrgA family protein [Yoonia sp. BS5-3]|uniref:TrgA family protein n=1 Tax=Yoonia phaeophyticola TaxID=3137369 RepID=A0ABZ2V3K3_9RHOB
MPTAGRLAGAVIFALFGWYIAGISTPFFPEERPPQYIIPMCFFVGIFVGWKVCGPRTGQGYYNAISNGLTTTAAFSFCVLGIIAFNAMIVSALRNRYDGPMEAIVGMFELMLEQGFAFFDIPFLTTLIGGGILCAMIAEFFGKNYS